MARWLLGSHWAMQKSWPQFSLSLVIATLWLLQTISLQNFPPKLKFSFKFTSAKLGFQLDEEEPPTEKSCTELLIRSAKGFLEKLGIEMDEVTKSHFGFKTFKSKPSSFKTLLILAKSIDFKKSLIKGILNDGRFFHNFCITKIKIEISTRFWWDPFWC